MAIARVSSVGVKNRLCRVQIRDEINVILLWHDRNKWWWERGQEGKGTVLLDSLNNATHEYCKRAWIFWWWTFQNVQFPLELRKVFPLPSEAWYTYTAHSALFYRRPKEGRIIRRHQDEFVPSPLPRKLNAPLNIEAGVSSLDPLSVLVTRHLA